MPFMREIAAIAREVQPNLGFRCLGIGVSQLADEHIRILPFAISFRNVRRDTPRRPTDLACQRVTLILRKRLRLFEDLHRQPVSQLINLQIPVASCLPLWYSTRFAQRLTSNLTRCLCLPHSFCLLPSAYCLLPTAYLSRGGHYRTRKMWAGTVLG